MSRAASSRPPAGVSGEGVESEDSGSAGRYALRLGLCVGLSIATHFAFRSCLQSLPARALDAAPRRATGRARRPAHRAAHGGPRPGTRLLLPPSAAPPIPLPAKPVVTCAPRRPQARPEPALPRDTPLDAAPTERPDPNADPDEEPRRHSMNSTTTAGNGPAFSMGNTLAGRPGPARAPGSKAPSALVGGGGGDAAPALEVTKMPLPRGRCVGRYTDAARAAGLEGTVVLDLTVGADGRTSDIRVVTGLGGGLSQAAIEAARGRRFTPGERNGEPVAVRIRAFKVSFALREAE